MHVVVLGRQPSCGGKQLPAANRNTLTVSSFIMGLHPARRAHARLR